MAAVSEQDLGSVVSTGLVCIYTYIHTYIYIYKPLKSDEEEKTRDVLVSKQRCQRKVSSRELRINRPCLGSSSSWKLLV